MIKLLVLLSAITLSINAFAQNPLAKSLQKLHGRVVLIESLRNAGHFIDAHESSRAKVTGCPQSELVQTVWSKFIVHYVGTYDSIKGWDNEMGLIVLESLRFRDHYLDMHDSKYGVSHHVNLTKAMVTPKDQTWAQFSVVGTNLDNVALRSEKWTNRWLDSHTSGFLLGTMSGEYNPPSATWGRFKFRFSAEISVTSNEVARLENFTDAPVKKTYEYKKGVSTSTSSTFTKTLEFKVEAEKNFGAGAFASGSVKFGASTNLQWSDNLSQNITEEQVVKIEVDVPAKTRYVISQVRGSYGPNVRIGSTIIQTKSEPIR